MRRIVPIGLTLLGAAIAAPASSMAQSAATKSPIFHRTAPAPAVKVVEGEAGHSHAHNHARGLFGKGRPCVECQRAKLAAQGIYVPPPPDALAGRIPAEGVCTSCQQAAAAGGQVVMMEGMPVESSAEPAGHAVVGDLGQGQPAGSALANAEPMPVGVVQTNYNSGAPAPYSVNDRIDPLARGHAGISRPDGPVPMNGPVPPAPTPASSGANTRPRVLAHLFGFDGIGRAGREAREQKTREQHAKISYGNQSGPISELPASMVYGRR
jgi:hypothetical protein